MLRDPPCEHLCQVQGQNTKKTHFDWLKGFDGPGKQYKYHLYAGSRGGNISFGLSSKSSYFGFLMWGQPLYLGGCHFVLCLYSSTTDIRLYRYRAATDFFIYGLSDK